MNDNLLIIDFEATCEDPPPEGYHFQIIEIGAAWVSPSGEVLDTFETLLRADQALSAFCTELTTITQAQSDSGLSFPEASIALVRRGVLIRLPVGIPQASPARWPSA